jgi:hypothetical protein
MRIASLAQSPHAAAQCCQHPVPSRGRAHGCTKVLEGTIQDRQHEVQEGFLLHSQQGVGQERSAASLGATAVAIKQASGMNACIQEKLPFHVPAVQVGEEAVPYDQGGQQRLACYWKAAERQGPVVH